MRRGLALYAARRARALRGGCCAVVTNSNGTRARPCRHEAVTAFDIKSMRYCTKHEDHWMDTRDLLTTIDGEG